MLDALDFAFANILPMTLLLFWILRIAQCYDSSDFIFFAEILQLTLLLYGIFKMKCDIF